MSKKILVIAHGHPDVNKGGAELAAFELYKEYERKGHDVKFLSRSDESPHGGAAFSTRNTDKEILFHTTHDDFFLFSNLKSRYIWLELRDFLSRFKPDVVHFHHYFLIGIESILQVKNTLPNAKIVLTLHEYLAICHNKGLMIKTNSNQLCHKATTKDCHRCFPEHSPADFFMREKYIKRIFSEVDEFISPSKFLKQRYVDWGIDPQKISVIENGQARQNTSIEAVSKQNSKVRFAFFGQVNEYKGVDILIEAFDHLTKSEKAKVTLDIHGANLEQQPKNFRKNLHKLLKENRKLVTYHGAYEPADLSRLMASIDWLVVPSIWWENSPLVIQEAFSHGVPVIVSDIGGMSEKVEDGINGLHFRVGKAADLANKIRYILSKNINYDDILNGISPPLSIDQTSDLNIAIYEK